MKDVGARLERRRLIGMRGNEDALARGVVFPMMIGADHAAVAHLAERELRAAMDAKVFPGMDAGSSSPIFTPDDQPTASHSWRRYGSSVMSEYKHGYLLRPSTTPSTCSPPVQSRSHVKK